jgi:hypothetical protein
VSGVPDIDHPSQPPARGLAIASKSAKIASMRKRRIRNCFNFAIFVEYLLADIRNIIAAQSTVLYLRRFKKCIMTGIRHNGRNHKIND